MESFSEELDDVINKSTSLGDWEILGLRAYKVPNETATTFNIINQETQDITNLKVADYDDTIRAQIPYGYNKSIQKIISTV